jgi:hypothetical protein
MNCLCELTIVIHQLLGHFNMAKVVSLIVELLHSVTFKWIHLINFLICTVTSNFFPTKQIPRYGRWQMTWWQAIHMIPKMPVVSLPQRQLERQARAGMELHHPMDNCEPTIVNTHQTSKVIGTVREYKSWYETPSLFDDIITSSNEIFKHFESNIILAIGIPGNLTEETVRS